MPMTAQERKSQLLADLVAARKHILELAATFSPKQGDAIFLGTWSVKDLIAHLIGWDFTNIQAMQDICADQLPQFYASHDRDWQTFNAQLVAVYKKDDLAELLNDALASHQQLIAHLQTLPAEEFDHDRGLRFRGWKVTMARLLRAEVEDEQNTIHKSRHLQQRTITHREKIRRLTHPNCFLRRDPNADRDCKAYPGLRPNKPL